MDIANYIYNYLKTKNEIVVFILKKKITNINKKTYKIFEFNLYLYIVKNAKN